MADGIYSALSGIRSQLQKLDLVSNNLANVNTAGYKKDVPLFYPFQMGMKEAAEKGLNPTSVTKYSSPDKSFSILKESIVQFSQGGLKKTGDPLSLAIQGDGFFMFKRKGEDMFSRGILLSINKEGQITNRGGDVLQGEGGPITVNKGVPVVISKDGTVYQNNQPIGKVKLQTVPDLNLLQKVGKNFYKMKTDLVSPIPASKAVVRQGYIEESNVNAINCMVDLVKVNRTIDILQKSISAFKDMDRGAISKVGGTG